MHLAPVVATFEYQGVASCASVACHHGNGPRGARGSEYTTWIAQGDPHSRAYTVLFEPRSRLIERNLNGLKRLPHEDTLCLSCHVNPDIETANHHERFARADGVGCESCHGPAEHWLSVHYTDSWKAMSAERKQREGMVNTKDLAVRAQACVRCHVGWRDADVNHDLIAAGHPRLRFEYGAYLANYPARHWKLEDDHKRYKVDSNPMKSDFEARAWLVGQVVSAKAAVELLEHRAEPKNRKPWPEFAEYGCFSCHHDLQDQAWRRKRNAGELPWGTWYFAQREIVAGILRSDRAADKDPFAKLSLMMAQNNSDQRLLVIVEARNAARVLDHWAKDLATREGWDEKALGRLLAALTREDPITEETDWDRAAQRYLGIAAVYNALGDVNAKYRRDVPLKTSVHRLADLLGNGFPKEPGVKYDSPRNYQPDLQRQDLKALREQLQRRGME